MLSRFDGLASIHVHIPVILRCEDVIEGFEQMLPHDLYKTFLRAAMPLAHKVAPYYCYDCSSDSCSFSLFTNNFSFVLKLIKTFKLIQLFWKQTCGNGILNERFVSLNSKMVVISQFTVLIIRSLTELDKRLQNSNQFKASR